MSATKHLAAYGSDIHEQAARSLFQSLEALCEGAVVVDREDARLRARNIMKHVCVASQNRG